MNVDRGAVNITDGSLLGRFLDSIHDLLNGSAHIVEYAELTRVSSVIAHIESQRICMSKKEKVTSRAMKRLAFMTYGRLVADYGAPRIQGFRDRVPNVYDSADRSQGFIARSIRDLENFSHSWGEVVAPRCWGGHPGSDIAATLSVWEDLESVAAFAYHGAHADAMKRRRDWFLEADVPEQVAWWIEPDETVTWHEAAARMDHLHRQGASAYAFNMKSPFDADGNPCKLRVDVVRANATALSLR